MHSIPGFDLVYHNPWRLLEFDKLAHMALFAGFVLTQIIAYRKQIAFRKLRNHAKKYAVLISLMYGGLLEFYQGEEVKEQFKAIEKEIEKEAE